MCHSRHLDDFLERLRQARPDGETHAEQQRCRSPLVIAVGADRSAESPQEPRSPQTPTSGTPAGLAYDHEALEERSAILEHEAGVPREEADAKALSATVPQSLSVSQMVKGRVWNVTLQDGTTCTVIMPTPMSQEQAEADIRRGPLGHRVVKVEEH
jgi:hypothetical protein